MTPFSTLIAGVAEGAGVYVAAVTDDWRQGRTLYGGLSAALCVAMAIRAVPDLPPLRSAQFAFIGPASGAVQASPSLLRRGRSAAFVSVDLMAEAGLATRALLCFGTARVSALSHDGLKMPDVPPPQAYAAFFGRQGAPNFSQHFDAHLARGGALISGGADPDMMLWLRHRDRAAANDAVALLALADASPPAAMVMFTAPAPISTMTWMVDILAEPPVADDGWCLMRSAAEAVADGYSSQAMTIWSASGRPLIAARQSVAIFV
jgi:acyl-CoA thioesterase